MTEVKRPNLYTILIGFYRRHISPYKGFSCAHRVLCGGMSCSEFALNQFQTKDPFRAYKETRTRMRACKDVYQEYLSKRSVAEQEAIEKRKRMRYVRLVNPQTYVSIAKSYLIHHWPKRNQQGDVL